MAASLVVATLALASFACGGAEPAEEPEETTESPASEATEGVAAPLPPVEVDLEKCEEGIYATKGSNATSRWEAAPAEERDKMCRQYLELPSKEDEAKLKEAAEANPEKNWSGGGVVMPDGSIRPRIEWEAEFGLEMKKAMEKVPGALDEAGNPANDSPQSQKAAARNDCVEASYEGMSREEKIERSREINAEAKARGVEPAEVVGC